MDDPLLLLLALFFSTLLASETSVHAQTSSNFLNIDCGKPEGYTYTDTAKDLGLTYTSDYAYIDTGEIGKVSPEYLSLGYRRNLDDLRSFPNGTRNCYTLKPVKLGAKYFIRALFLYGNYDRENLLPQFDIYLGVNFWDSISFDKASDYIKSEILAVAASDLLSLCLANTGQGTPFISAIEVRPLSDDFYPSLLSSSRAFRYFYMGNFGGDFYRDLSENELTGAIPNFLANLPNLKFLDLRGNNLTGPIPQELQNNVASGTLTLWIGNPETKVGNKKKNSKSIIAAVVGSICAVLFVAVVVALILCYTRKKKRNRDSVQGKQKKEYEQQKQTSPGGVFHSENRRFTYDDIVKITRKFSKVIGEGGFGFVYLGVLENGTQVAVKVLSKTSTQGHKQFQNEAVLLSKIHHRNLVALFGYCSDPDHLALVYEYMEEGSLDDHLSGKTGNEKLSGWKKRLEIAVGAAQGLEYLHEGCKLSIVHRDVKTKNILLDRNMETKIADFGLSKIFQNDMQTYVSTVVMGTPGYLDPEYSSTNMLKEKSDVYSFGIVLLQLATGLPAIIRGKENTHIVNWVIQWYEKGAIEEIVDKRLDGKYDIGSVWKMLEVALTCASPVSSERPTMAEVLVQLKDCLVMESGRDRFQGDMSTVEDETLLDLQAR